MGDEGPSDEALLAAMAVGDREAAVTFVRRYQRRTYGLALSMLSDPSMAEDVAQEAMLRAWRHAPVFDARRGSVSTWVLTITRNLAVDALRLRRADPVDPADLARASLASSERGPADQAATSDMAGRLRAAIAQLPSEQRRALVLASFFGRTAREIAASESIPLGTAKTRIRSAMIRLREALPDAEALA